MPITVRSAESGDLAFIARGNAAMALETEHRSLDERVVALGVQAAFADASRGRYFVAELDGRVVGQLMVTYEWSDWRNGAFWWIQSVYVLPEARRCGAFSALYAHVDSLAKATPGVCGLRLYVEFANERAQATYRRCGMVDAGYRVMEVDYSGAAPDNGD
jgi:GNAT superfamily N-acetyltransferase